MPPLRINNSGSFDNRTQYAGNTFKANGKIHLGGLETGLAVQEQYNVHGQSYRNPGVNGYGQVRQQIHYAPQINNYYISFLGCEPSRITPAPWTTLERFIQPDKFQSAENVTPMFPWDQTQDTRITRNSAEIKIADTPMPTEDFSGTDFDDIEEFIGRKLVDTDSIDTDSLDMEGWSTGSPSTLSELTPEDETLMLEEERSLPKQARDRILNLPYPVSHNESTKVGRYIPPPLPFQCNLCPKASTRAYNLQSHLRTHTNERPFVCSVCEERFTRQYDRKAHERHHSRESKFQCEGALESQPGAFWGCGQKFSSAETLDRHFQSQVGEACIKPVLDEATARVVAKAAADIMEVIQRTTTPTTTAATAASHHAQTEIIPSLRVAG